MTHPDIIKFVRKVSKLRETQRKYRDATNHGAKDKLLHECKVIGMEIDIMLPSVNAILEAPQGELFETGRTKA